MALTVDTPRRLISTLAVYFVVLVVGLSVLGTVAPGVFSLMPFGGTDALEVASLEIQEDEVTFRTNRPGDEVDQDVAPPTARQVGLVSLHLLLSLIGTMLAMIPIAWTFSATKREIGYRKNFVRALIVLPICATTIVLLIQDSLALAFGLAAMVAAVRFRVALDETIDGIYIFSGIAVGLAAGIGYLGLGMLMAMVFCFANAVMWAQDFGSNPVDEARQQKKRAKLKEH